MNIFYLPGSCFTVIVFAEQGIQRENLACFFVQNKNYNQEIYGVRKKSGIHYPSFQNFKMSRRNLTLLTSKRRAIYTSSKLINLFKTII